MTAAVSAVGLSKRYGRRDALCELSFDVARGEVLAITGRNGSGKSTLLRILATLARPDSGEATVDGADLRSSPAAVRARIGVVLDHAMLPRDLTVADGLRLTASLHGIRGAELRIPELAEQLGILSRLDDPVAALSRGMRQRAALCRAWLGEPPVLLLDEPTTALDGSGTAVLAALIRESAKAGAAVLLATHDLAFADAVAGRRLELERGSACTTGTVGTPR